MKIKLDENLPVHLAAILINLRHDVHTIAKENLSGKSDREVWEAAQQDERFLITQDLDFSDLRTIRSGNAFRNLTGSASLSGSRESHSSHLGSVPARGSGGLVEVFRSRNGAQGKNNPGSWLNSKKGTAEAMPFFNYLVFSVTPCLCCEKPLIPDPIHKRTQLPRTRWMT